MLMPDVCFAGLGTWGNRNVLAIPRTLRKWRRIAACFLESAMPTKTLLGAAALFFCAFVSLTAATPRDTAAKVTIDWNQVLRVSKTTATLQVVVNPPLRPGSAIHDQAWKSLSDLHADYVRFVPWLPYPRLAVAELEPPTAGHTSWDFSLIDPVVSDFFNATNGHPIMLNFSTIPQWMFRTDAPVTFSSDANEVTWNYEQGKELRDPTGKEVGDYFARVANWYANGGFTDEIGKFHASPFHHKIALWEVLNEPDYEHKMSPETYTQIYDAIVEPVHKVLPSAQFVGMSLAEPSNSPRFFEYFLNPAHHKPGIPLDWISYHFYAVPTPGQTISEWQYTFFDQADKFLTSVKFIEAIRERLSPGTKTAINEVGCILPTEGATEAEAGKIPASYWNLCGAMFAYLYVELTRRGIDIVGSSQLVGFPTQFPSVTMLDWKTGQPNARYQVLKLLRDHFAPGDQLVSTTLSSPHVLAQAFVAADGGRKVLLVNKRDRPIDVLISGATGSREFHVDLRTGGNPASSSTFSSDTVPLAPFSVCVIQLKQ